MTTTTIDSPPIDAGLGAPAPAPTRTTPSLLGPSPLAERLLSEAHDGRASSARRVAVGVSGLSVLAVVPAAAASLFRTLDFDIPWLDRLLMVAMDALSLPIVAALTVTLTLPGLAIVLGVVNQSIPALRIANAVSRAYCRLGLLSLGMTPTLLLYALTGLHASSVELAVALCYFACGALALFGLHHELASALPEPRLKGRLVLTLWFLFVVVFGLHLFLRLDVTPWM